MCIYTRIIRMYVVFFSKLAVTITTSITIAFRKTIAHYLCKFVRIKNKKY